LAEFDGSVPAKAGFSAPKRVFKSAVERNYIKRRMREAYRQLKPSFYETLTAQNRRVLLVFVFTRYVEKVSVQELSDVISKALERLTKQDA
jgi:ribonuclease P protein component